MVVREGETGVLETKLQVGEAVEDGVVEGVVAMMTGVEVWLLFSEEGLQSVQVGEVHGEKRSGSRGVVSVVLGGVLWGEAIFARSRGDVHCFPIRDGSEGVDLGRKAPGEDQKESIALVAEAAFYVHG